MKKTIFIFLVCLLGLCGCQSADHPDMYAVIPSNAEGYINPPDDLSEEELDRYMQIDSYYGLKYSHERYKELVKVYTQFSVDDSIMIQITCQAELEKFNEAFSDFDVQIKENDFSQNYILASIHSPLASVEIERDGSDGAVFNKLYVSRYTSNDDQIASSLSQDMLFVYLTECIVLKTKDGRALNSLHVEDTGRAHPS